MKKISKLIMSVILLSTFSGCNRVGLKDGTEAAKLLLANERLDVNDLRKDGNLFTKGKQAFNRVKEQTRKYSNRINDLEVKSKFNKNGNIYSWSDAPDYSNFLSFFNSYADNIEHSSEVGSKLIDSTKKNVRVVNKWIDIGMFSEDEILLIVDENAETIFSRTESQYEICRRYQNNEGSNVFEMAIENFDTNSISRMTYIPGQRYEYSSIQDEHMLVIVADNDKGYWDIMSTSFHPGDNESYNFTNLVMKDEAIYETSFGLYEGREQYSGVEIVSSNNPSDILSYSEGSLTLFTTGMTGLDSFYIEAKDSEVWDLTENDHQYPENHDDYKVFSVGEEGDKQYFTQYSNSPTIKFTNGKEMNAGDSFYNDEIIVSSSMINPIGGLDFYGEINFRVNSSDIDKVFENLKKLANEFGFGLKGGIDVVYKSTKYAIEDSKNFSKYYIWNGYHINKEENIKKAIDIEKVNIEEFATLYNEVKDYEVIREGEQAKLDASIHFSDVEIIENGIVENDNFNLTINNLKLNSLDTILYVVNDSYKVEIAVANEENGQFVNIMPLSSSNDVKVFEGGKTFEATYNGSFEIPSLVEGEYTLVAYIATSEEGIRVTKPIALRGNINESILDFDGTINRLYNDSNKIKISSSRTSNINISLSGEYTYESLYNELEAYAYKYGETTKDNIEVLNNNEWTKINESSEIEKGTYRLSYISNNKTSYVIATIS